MSRILRQRFEVRAAQAAGIERRQDLADFRLVAREARLCGVVQIDDLMMRVRQHDTRRGPVEGLADPRVLRGDGAFHLDLAAQLALHLIECAEHLAGFIGAGGFDPVVVVAFRDPFKHLYRRSQRSRKGLRDEPRERNRQGEREKTDSGCPVTPEGEVGGTFHQSGAESGKAGSAQVVDGANRRHARVVDFAAGGLHFGGIQDLRLQRRVELRRGAAGLGNDRLQASFRIGSERLRFVSDRCKALLHAIVENLNSHAVIAAEVSLDGGTYGAQAHVGGIEQRCRRVVGRDVNQGSRVRVRVRSEPGVRTDQVAELLDVSHQRCVSGVVVVRALPECF